MVGQTLERLFPDGLGTSALEREMADAVSRGRGGGDEGWRVRKDGSLIWAAGEMTPICDLEKKVVGFTKVLRDRSSKREAEQALMEERRALEVLNRAGSALAAEHDVQQLVQIVTDAGVELTGAEFGAFFYNVEDDAGENYMLYTLSGAPAEAFSQFPMPRKTGVFGPTFAGEGIVRSADITKDPRYGRNAPFEGMPQGHLPVRSYLAVPVFSRSGDVLGGLFFGHADVGVFSEESERGLQGLAAEAAVAIDNARLFASLKRTEERLRALNERLEQEVEAEVTRRGEAEDALRQAQKMEAIGQLTGGIAHDFNNLLAGISGSLEVIERRISKGRTEGIDRFVAGALASTQRAAALTQRLLAFSRRQTLDPEPTDVNRLVLGMEDLIHRTVGPAIKIEVVGAAGLWPTKVDAAQLESALLNLAINARDAMPEGGRITIETANKWIDGRAGRERDLTPGQYISICVTDTGTGIPKEIADRIFDPFFTTKPIGQGTGLGLSMIHGFVRQSGGQVRVYSEPGHGTTMCLYLPRYTGELEDDPETVETTIAEIGTGETVLVIDDEPTVRMLIVEVLEEAGYSALEAEDGPTGLKILQSSAQIDLLITDVGLPGGMNGRQVADAARIGRPELKVLFVTGFAENAAVGNGHLDPGMAVITKPFVMAELAHKITEMIES
jgi:signal transduction histidine kinase